MPFIQKNQEDQGRFRKKNIYQQAKEITNLKLLNLCNMSKLSSFVDIGQLNRIFPYFKNQCKKYFEMDNA